ncbi:1530_t:CDS:1 [Diversispora eburnea]|uniref:1530_t:CDS:1 n=1 Tax=Diversispora eburnea TaxID=1213867 RepID=A0A9N9C7H0_9GLOM|nr:1530_t:CDS:1 [Diversispora eburnea]
MLFSRSTLVLFSLLVHFFIYTAIADINERGGDYYKYKYKTVTTTKHIRKPPFTYTKCITKPVKVSTSKCNTTLTKQTTIYNTTTTTDFNTTTVYSPTTVFNTTTVYSPTTVFNTTTATDFNTTTVYSPTTEHVHNTTTVTETATVTRSVPCDHKKCLEKNAPCDITDLSPYQCCHTLSCRSAGQGECAKCLPGSD